MASALATLHREVRRLIGDRRKGDPVCVEPFLEELTNAAIEELSVEMGTGTIRTSPFVTLTAGVGTFTLTLPSSIPSIQDLQDLVLDSLGYPLEKKPLEFIIAMRVNVTDPRGIPRFYAIREDNAQVTTLEIHPVSVSGDTATAYWSPVHRRVETMAGTVAGTAYTTLGFSKRGLTALRLRVAARAILSLSPDLLKRLNPPKSAAFGGMLLEQSKSIAVDEFFRLNQSSSLDQVQGVR